LQRSRNPNSSGAFSHMQERRKTAASISPTQRRYIKSLTRQHVSLRIAASSTVLRWSDSLTSSLLPISPVFGIPSYHVTALTRSRYSKLPRRDIRDYRTHASREHTFGHGLRQSDCAAILPQIYPSGWGHGCPRGTARPIARRSKSGHTHGVISATAEVSRW
jgi:hypothetical protein